MDDELKRLGESLRLPAGLGQVRGIALRLLQSNELMQLLLHKVNRNHQAAGKTEGSQAWAEEELAEDFEWRFFGGYEYEFNIVGEIDGICVNVGFCKRLWKRSRGEGSIREPCSRSVWTSRGQVTEESCEESCEGKGGGESYENASETGSKSSDSCFTENIYAEYSGSAFTNSGGC